MLTLSRSSRVRLPPQRLIDAPVKSVRQATKTVEVVPETVKLPRVALVPVISFQDRLQEEEEFQACVTWAISEGKGAMATITKLQTRFLSTSALHRRIHTTVRNGGTYSYYAFHDQRRVLTLPEEQQLADFIKESGDRNDGQKRCQLNVKIVEILELRRANNSKGGRKFARPSATTEIALSAISRTVP
jgi:hypothetical protein